MLSGDDIVVLMGIMAAAVALAGFASLVTSIDRGAVGTSSAVISFQVLNLIVGAWCAVLLSLVPIGLETLQIATHSLWQCASMIAAWVIAFVMLRAWIGRKGLRGPEGQGFSRALYIVDTALGAFALAMAILGAAGIVAARGALFVTLFYLLVLTGTLFYRMIQMADEAARNLKGRER